MKITCEELFPQKYISTQNTGILEGTSIRQKLPIVSISEISQELFNAIH